VYFGNGPYLACPSREDHRVVPPRRQTEPIGESTGKDDQCGSSIDKKIDVLAASSGTDKTSRDSKQAHVLR
jgi:hypothetical protein